MPPGMLSITAAQPVEQAATIRYPGYRLLRLPTFKQDATGESVPAYAYYRIFSGSYLVKQAIVLALIGKLCQKQR